MNTIAPPLSHTFVVCIRLHHDKVGILSDAAVGRLAGVSAASVEKYRRMFGILSRYNIADRLDPWTALIGIESDPKVAALAGVSRASVIRYRGKHKIPAPPRTPREPSAMTGKPPPVIPDVLPAWLIAAGVDLKRLDVRVRRRVLSLPATLPPLGSVTDEAWARLSRVPTETVSRWRVQWGTAGGRVTEQVDRVRVLSWMTRNDTAHGIAAISKGVKMRRRLLRHHLTALVASGGVEALEDPNAETLWIVA